MKVDIPEFEGIMQLEEFIDWLYSIDRVFDYKDVPGHRKVKFDAIKLKKYSSLWWENLKKHRAPEGRSRIVTWEKMRKELKRKFLPGNYRQDIFHKFHNFKQKELSVEEYTAELDHLKLRCDVSKPEEQTIARYLGGLRSNIANVVQLQPYWTYNDVFKLAIKVEHQLKESQGIVIDLHIGKVLPTWGVVLLLSLHQHLSQPISNHLPRKMVGVIKVILALLIPIIDNASNVMDLDILPSSAPTARLSL